MITKETHPKSWAKFAEFVKRLTNTTNIDPKVSGQLPVENVIPVILNLNPRVLYDFFDELGICVFIKTTSINNWTHYIHKKTKDDIISRQETDTTILNTRIEAEKHAFETAFALLELYLR